MTKIAKVEQHLKKYKRGITSWECIKRYQYTRLSDAIYTLKQRGYRIGDVWEHDSKTGDRWKKYFLI